MEDITDAYYKYAKRVCRNFKINNLGEYYDLSDQSDTLLLADVFNNFRNMCLKKCELDPGRIIQPQH